MLEYKLSQLRKWFDEKTNLITKYFASQSKPKRRLICKMGEIYFAKIGINVGFEVDKHRPVVVFQGSDIRRRNADLVFVFPITSNLEIRDDKVLFYSGDLEDGDLHDGAILVYQGRAISKVRLTRYIGKLRPEKLFKIRAVLNTMLYKNTPLEGIPPGGHTDALIAQSRDKRV